jgi:hypothetical protein
VREKTCKVCRIRFMPSRPMQTCCSVSCAIDYSRMQATKAEVVAALNERKTIKMKLEKLKTRSQWIKEVQVEFNKFIRLRDQLAGHNCISSGRVLDWSGNAVDAGHYRSIGSAPHLRFNEDNCHAQSKHDNQYKSGNAVDYRIGLIARIGLEAVEALEADNEPRKYSIEELKAIKALYVAKLKELRNGH